MTMTVQTIELASEPVTPFRIAIVQSMFNRSITDLLLEGALERLRKVKQYTSPLLIVEVPGAVEIPVIVDQLLSQENEIIYDAIIALGAVIRGETDHYCYVCQQVSDGCARLSLHYHVPVIFGVLTVDNIEQARARVGEQTSEGSNSKSNKGYQVAEAALQMIVMQQKIRDTLC